VRADGDDPVTADQYGAVSERRLSRLDDDLAGV